MTLTVKVCDIVDVDYRSDVECVCCKALPTLRHRMLFATESLFLASCGHVMHEVCAHFTGRCASCEVILSVHNLQKGKVRIVPDGCVVCGNRVSKGKQYVRPCGHTFHKVCMRRWDARTCRKQRACSVSFCPECREEHILKDSYANHISRLPEKRRLPPAVVEDILDLPSSPRVSPMKRVDV